MDIRIFKAYMNQAGAAATWEGLSNYYNNIIKGDVEK